MRIEISPKATKLLAYLARDHDTLHSVLRALGKLEQCGPEYPALRSKVYKGTSCPHGDALWQSYVTQRGAAYRIWWCYPPEKHDTIYVVELGPHP